MPTSLTKLLNLYSVPGGRYTYYPAHAAWKNNFNYFQWWDAVKNSYDPSKGVDLYIHIPFCESVCTFCGCNIRVTKNYPDVIPYLAALKKEWDLYKKILPEEININSIYIGGGTPNFLHPNDLDQLLNFFVGQNNEKKVHISIEIDPRFLSTDQLIVLKNYQINTLSFGIQDFSAQVLHNVNREQNISDILAILHEARDMGFPNINVDLIYGLTHQTNESINNTLDILSSYLADTIALYPLAKVPWQNNSQKAFGDTKDFSRTEMNELFSHTNSKLKELGYVHIGMGHFAHNESNIMEQFIDKKLKRNIMGFTDTKSNLLIGLGVSAFSNSSTGHVQNEKVLEQYIHSLNKDMPPIQKSHAMTSEENYLTNLFEKIICENTFNQEDRKKILPDQEANFNIYLNNHFIEENQKSFIITDLGRYFLKNICQCWG